MLLIDGRLDALLHRLPEGTNEDDLLARLLGPESEGPLTHP
jgi:hypothetical protein